MTISHNKNKINRQLKSLGIFNNTEGQKRLNVSLSTLSRWAKNGKIKKVAPGLYMHPELPIAPEDLDFAIAIAKFGPQSAISGLSALFYHHFTNQVSRQIWIVIPSHLKDESSTQKYKCLRTKTSLQYGILRKKYFNITNIERSLLESMKFDKKIGMRVVVAATRKALREKMTNESKLAQTAKQLKMEKVLAKYWESIIEWI